MAVWTQAEADALKAAIATGVLEVLYAGPPERRVRYQNLTEMRDLLADMLRDIAGNPAEGGSTYSGARYRLARVRKGT